MTRLRVIPHSSIEGFLESRGAQGLILSALNLFMLGFLKDNQDFPSRSYFWCDGILGVLFARLNGHKLKQLRGAKLLEALLCHHKGDAICVLGALSDDGQLVLARHEVTVSRQYPMPDFQVETLALMSFEFNASVVLLTLPSPIQERVAFQLAQRFPQANFYCIGGALNMLAHPELDCPPLVQHLGMEFLFRLRTDTGRRIRRLFGSLRKALCSFDYLRRCRIEVIG